MNPCPYCETRLDGPGPVVCRGCGSAVALGATTLAIAVWLDEPIWKQQEFASMVRAGDAGRATGARFFPVAAETNHGGTEARRAAA